MRKKPLLAKVAVTSSILVAAVIPAVAVADAIGFQTSQTQTQNLQCTNQRLTSNLLNTGGSDRPGFQLNGGLPRSGRYAIVQAQAEGGCSPISEGKVFFRRKGLPSSQYVMSNAIDYPYRVELMNYGGLYFSYYATGVYFIDTTVLPDGEYEWIAGGYTNEQGEVAGYTVSRKSFTVNNQNSTTSTTSTTTTIPPTDVPEVLADDLTLVVHRPNRFASAYYSAVVRCSNRCGKLPDVFQAKLCEVGTSYRSSTCISSAAMSPNGSKKKVTKTSTTNMFFGTFAFNKAPTGKRYRVYLNIPAGRNHAPVQGIATVAWTRKTANPPTTTTIPASTTTTLPGATTTSTTIVNSGQSVAVVSDFVGGLKTANVQGANTSVGVEVTLSCSGKCTALPSFINARLCKVGTSYLDASCTTAQSIVRTSGTLNSTYFGQLRLGLDPTGLKYQPYFSILATGVSGYVRIGGTSRLTWTK